MIPGQTFGQELQCDEAMQLSILRLVYDTHAAAAELLKNAVMGNRCPDHVDGSLTVGTNRTLGLKGSQTIGEGGGARGPMPASGDPRSRPLGSPFNAVV